ncbi:chorismate-binding protein [Flavobacterium tibetense]|uniref:isochorismate synthase n=1 Tax=Flavobacterium tibetense TaxID=2233533 RepID=A0A365P184_9FLAO|nr:chorismate-binding protein [Flavobacterium tibetense]RBA28284.1 isochorismate synthase [Flavobacterium tibetense]
MPIFKEIQALLAKENPFVCYIKPNETKWNLLIQNNDEIIPFSGQSGFVFAPFDAGLKVVIPITEADLSTGILEEIKANKSINLDVLVTNQKEAFEQLVTNGIQAITNGNFEKVVLSRKIEITKEITIIETFQNLISSYPTAFRYLFFHPKVGIWLGATPEQLVKIKDNRFETMALAGTQLYSENVIWETKEIEEQQFVTNYILAKVKNKANMVKVSEFQTVKAGNLAHLQSLISGELTSDFQALELIESLHPTPAVCGLPKENAIDFISKNEGYDRKYYTGFLGEFQMNNQTDLFVNLRCLEVEKNTTNIYVGCGITKDSIPEKEFIETENKSMTMRNILVFSAQ